MWSIPTTHPTTVPHSNCITVIAKPLESHSHHRNNLSRDNFSSNPYSGAWTLHQDRRSLSALPVQKSPATGPLRASMRCRCLSRTGSCHQTSPLELPTTDLQAYVPGFPIQHLHHPLLSIFLSGDIYFQILFYFSSKFDTTEAPLTIWSCFVPFESTDSVASMTLY